MKVLQDMTLNQAQKNLENSKKVTITLEEPLRQNTKYSILSILGAQGSIDFQTGDFLENQEIPNTSLFGQDQNIQSITIINDKILDLNYVSDVVESDFEYKLLQELEVLSIENTSAADERLIVNLGQEITADREYILMVISLIGSDGDEITFDTGIYDFTSPESLEKSQSVIDAQTPKSSKDITTSFNQEAQMSVQEKIAQRNAAKLLEVEQAEVTVQEIPMQDSLLPEEEELNAAPSDTGLMKSTLSVAAEATMTPDAGAETWVLIFATLLINTFYYFSRRKVA